LCGEASPYALQHYNGNWHHIKTEWVTGLKEGLNLGNQTNNRIESINDKVKSVVKHNSSLHEFAEKLLVIIKSLRTERDHKTVNLFQKRPVLCSSESSPEYQFRLAATPYACSFINEQLNLRHSVQLSDSADENDIAWTAETSEGTLTVTITS